MDRVTARDGKLKPAKFTLPNGLRLLVLPEPGSPRAAVTVHYRVGFRSEPRGREGMAHLFEHLMFRGSESLPSGGYFRDLAAIGGHANGTTHQDYTDYYQVVPANALERALFSEADRMRAPCFAPESLAEQLRAVEEEIRHAVHGHAYGGFPWPLLPGVLFDTFPNAHDGYGDVSVLSGVTVDECADFFGTYYTPGNAVLTVCADITPDQALPLVERHFGDIAPRVVPPRPSLTEPPLAADRLEVRRVPGAGPLAVAAGYRLPDPATDLGSYLAHVVLARLLTPLCDTGRPAGISDASCGFFGPLDALDPDALVVTLTGDPRQGPDHALAPLDARLRQLAASSLDEAGLQCVLAGLVRDHDRTHHAPLVRSRTAGRLEVLFGRGELAHEIPQRLGALSPADITAAAAALQEARRAVLVLEPGHDPCFPPSGPDRAHGSAAGPACDRDPGARAAGRSARTANGPRPLPAMAASPRPGYDAIADTSRGGARVIAVRDARAPLIEVRLRLPLPPDTTTAESQVLAEVLSARWSASAQLAGTSTGSVQGRWLHLDACLPADADRSWPSALSVLVRAPVTDFECTSAVQRALARPPALGSTRRRILDATVERLTRGRNCPEGSTDSALPHVRPFGAPRPPRVHALSASLSASHALFTVVGDIAPDAVADQALRVLAVETRTAGEGPSRAIPLPQDTQCLIEHPGPGPAQLVWFAPEAPLAGNEAARYLSVAVLGGGHPEARLSRLAMRHEEFGYLSYAGRDSRLGAARVFAAAEPPDHRAAQAFGEIHRELRGIAERPPAAMEVAAAREYCVGQLLGAFDTQSALADQVTRWTVAGNAPAAFPDFAEQLAMVPSQDVAEAAVELFARTPFTGVLVGEVDPTVAGSTLTEEKRA
ncbi:insulinase family protein [Streptomyces sioyaensis]|uniref:M16 family metallopeptidase n=1 Tax=Streptomyces sioyaensis TaxID=67364 RepID=UPI003D7063B8